MDDMLKCWYSLANEIRDEDDNVKKAFALAVSRMILPRHPLETVKDLALAKKCPKLIPFILEHVDIDIKVDLRRQDPKPVAEFDDACYGSDNEDSEFSGWKRINDSGKGLTPIHLAAWFGISESVEKLVVKYDSPMVQSEEDDRGVSFNCIQIAAFRGHVNVIKILAPLTTNPLASDSIGWTPLHHAADRGHLEVVKVLVGLLDDVSYYWLLNTPTVTSSTLGGDSPIYLARRHRHTEVAQFLMKSVNHPLLIRPRELDANVFHTGLFGMRHWGRDY